MQQSCILFFVLVLIISPSFAQAPSSLPLVTPSVPGSFDCGFCEFIITLIYGFIAENSTEQQIIEVVDGICTYVPTSLTELVRNIVKTILNLY